MTRHYLVLGCVSDWISNATRPIRSTTQVWVVTRHQYGISALVSQTSFRGETSGDVAKCWLPLFPPLPYKGAFKQRRRRRLRLRKRHLKSEFALHQVFIAFIPSCSIRETLAFFLELNSKRLYRSSVKEKQSGCLVFTSSTKREIRYFHVVVVH